MIVGRSGEQECVAVQFGRGPVLDTNIGKGYVEFLGNQRGQRCMDSLTHFGARGHNRDAATVDQDIWAQQRLSHFEIEGSPFETRLPPGGKSRNASPARARALSFKKSRRVGFEAM